MSVLLGNRTTEAVATANDIHYLPFGDRILNATTGYAFDAESSAGVELINDGTMVSLQDAGIYSGGLNFTFLNGRQGLVRGEEEGINVGGDYAELTNHGEIAGLQDGVRFFTGIGGVLDNAGTVWGNSFGFYASGYDVVIINSGDLSGDTAIHGLSNSDLVLNNSGHVTGRLNYGIWMASGDLTLVNTGIITGGQAGLFFEIGGNADYQVTNSGTISGGIIHTASTGLALDNSGLITGGIAYTSIARGLDLFNSGLITGDVTITNSPGARVVNMGTIEGSLTTSSLDDVVVNAGTITGDIQLGAGNDLYRAKGAIAHDGMVFGGTGNDRMYGTGDDDEFAGGNNTDRLYGRGGDDVLEGGIGNDLLYGGAGDDILIGDKGVDELRGGQGDDLLDGGDRSDLLIGGRGDDYLLGGDDNDVLLGGQGNDLLSGGQGDDVFVFGRSGEGHDIITDFGDGADLIDLTSFGLANFAALNSAGALSAGLGGTVVDLTQIGGEGSVVLDGVALGSVTGGDFLF